MELLYPFVETALPLAYGVLGVLLFHVKLSAFDGPKKYMQAFHWKSALSSPHSCFPRLFVSLSLYSFGMLFCI